MPSCTRRPSLRLRTSRPPRPAAPAKPAPKAAKALSDDVPFIHLHAHSQFSILQAVGNVGELVDGGEPRHERFGHYGPRQHDGGFQFVRAANKAGIKAIVGAELNVCRDHTDRSSKDDGYPTVFLAKNKNGYHNLTKLSSKAYTDGFYYVPRIDKALVEQFKEDIIHHGRAVWGDPIAHPERG